MKLHVRRLDNSKDKGPWVIYFIDMESLIDGHYTVYVEGRPIEYPEKLLMLDTRPAHPQEYAEALVRLIQVRKLNAVDLVDLHGKYERENDIVQKYLQYRKGVFSEDFIRALLSVR